MANSLAAGKPVSTKGVHVLEQAPLDDLANLSAKTLSSSKEGHGPWRSGASACTGGYLATVDKTEVTVELVTQDN
uniref:Uncharacterized protein n=1 Tax=Oryza glumipatula TaxID=40148 RepID=A0A0D9Y7U1_9ORYZ